MPHLLLQLATSLWDEHTYESGSILVQMSLQGLSYQLNFGRLSKHTVNDMKRKTHSIANIPQFWNLRRAVMMKDQMEWPWYHENLEDPWCGISPAWIPSWLPTKLRFHETQLEQLQRQRRPNKQIFDPNWHLKLMFSGTRNFRCFAKSSARNYSRFKRTYSHFFSFTKTEYRHPNG